MLSESTALLSTSINANAVRGIVERQSDLQFAKPGWLHFNNSIHYLIRDYKHCGGDERGYPLKWREDGRGE